MHEKGNKIGQFLHKVLPASQNLKVKGTVKALNAVN